MVCDRCRCGDIHDVKRLVYVASIFSSGSSGLKLSEVVGRSGPQHPKQIVKNTHIRHGKHIHEGPASTFGYCKF